jgi:hypothetical protein
LTVLLLGRLGALGDRVAGRWPRDVLSSDQSEPVLTEEPAAVFSALVRVALVLVTLQTVLHLVNAVVFDLRIDRLDADGEQTVWSWAASAAELTAALGPVLLLVLVPRRWKSLGFLALAFAFFSMDETVQIHERLANLGLFNAAGISGRFVWPVLYAPVMLITFVLLWRVSGALVQRCRSSVRTGLVLLGVAVVLEFAVSTVLVSTGHGRVDGDTRVGSLLYELEVVAEEGAESGGWLLIAAGLIAGGLDVLVRRARARAEVPTGR